jgi:hypothetical protein
MDVWLLRFVGENWMTMYLAITAMKGIALITPSVVDDKVVTLLSQIYGALRSGKAPERIPGDAEEKVKGGI